jgi:AcrR family transcriptional regulator
MASTSSSSRKRRRPGRPRRDERLAEGSRARLLDAAAEVFAGRGYERASLDEVAARAGLSKGTIYWHFASKEELFLALLDERIDRPARALMDITGSAPRDQPTAGAVDAALGQLVREQPEFVQLLLEYWAAAVRDPKLGKRYVERQQALRQTLADVIRARQPPDVPFHVAPEHLATAFIALAFGLALEMLVDPKSVPKGLYGEILSLAYDGNAARGGRLPDD